MKRPVPKRVTIITPLRSIIFFVKPLALRALKFKGAKRSHKKAIRNFKEIILKHESRTYFPRAMMTLRTNRTHAVGMMYVIVVFP